MKVLSFLLNKKENGDKERMKKNKTVIEICPTCGNEIEVDARPGEVRKCPFCRRRYVVQYEKRNRKYLDAYLKVSKDTDEASVSEE